MSDRRLVITADDFGLHPAVNAAVEIAHTRGVLTAASLMVGAPATAEAVALAHAMPNLRVGLHIVLTEGHPVLPPENVPHLTGPDGAFRNDMAAMGAVIFASPAARRELTSEIEAQFTAFAATGLQLDHANGHKHFHVHPTIARAIATVGGRFGLRAVRIPREPASVLEKLEPGAAPWPDRLTSWWGGRASGPFRRAGMLTPDQVFGLRWTGQMSARRLAGLIGALPPGLSEVYLHPATASGFAGSAPGYDYRGDLAALTSGEVLQASGAASVRRGGFHDFV